MKSKIGARVSFGSRVKVFRFPEFLALCLDVATRLNEQLGNVTIRFFEEETTNYGHRLYAQVAWRNIVFAELAHYAGEENKALLRIQEPGGAFTSYPVWRNDKVWEVLKVLLRMLKGRVWEIGPQSIHWPIPMALWNRTLARS